MTVDRSGTGPRAFDRGRQFAVAAVCCVVLATLIAGAPGGAGVSLVFLLLAGRRGASRALRWSLAVSCVVLAAFTLLVLIDTGLGGLSLS